MTTGLTYAEYKTQIATIVAGINRAAQTRVTLYRALKDIYASKKH